MKWIGQHIYDLASRFRNDVFLEDISTGTIASGAHLGLDSNNKIVKAADGGGDLTSIVAGTGLSGTSLTGPIPTLNVDASQTQITAVGALNSGTVTSGFGNFDNGSSTLNTGAATVTGLNVVTAAADGNPLITFKQSTTRRGFIQMADTDNNLRIASEFGKVEISAASTDGSDSDTAYLQIAPTGIFRFGAADNDATLTADGNMIFRIDADNDETGQSFAFQNNASTEIANLNESGDLQLDGDLTADAIELGHASDTTMARAAAGIVSIEGVNIAMQSLRIKLIPSSFASDDSGRPIMIDDTGEASENFFVESNGSAPVYAFVDIPTGYKATHIMVHGSATDAIECWEMQIDSKTGVSKGTGNVDTEINITDVTSSTTNYLLIQVANASGNEIHGGYVTIAVA